MSKRGPLTIAQLCAHVCVIAIKNNQSWKVAKLLKTKDIVPCGECGQYNIPSYPLSEQCDSCLQYYCNSDDEEGCGGGNFCAHRWAIHHTTMICCYKCAQEDGDVECNDCGEDLKK